MTDGEPHAAVSHASASAVSNGGGDGRVELATGGDGVAVTCVCVAHDNASTDTMSSTARVAGERSPLSDGRVSGMRSVYRKTGYRPHRSERRV